MKTTQTHMAGRKQNQEYARKEVLFIISHTNIVYGYYLQGGPFEELQSYFVERQQHQYQQQHVGDDDECLHMIIVGVFSLPDLLCVCSLHDAELPHQSGTQFSFSSFISNTHTFQQPKKWKP